VGERFGISGRLADGSWWRVRAPLAACWLWAKNISLEGDLLRVPILTPPATPTATDTPTPTPTPTDTPTPTPTDTPSPTPTPTDTATPTATDTPADSVPPVIKFTFAAKTICTGAPAQIDVFASDASPIRAVDLTWSIGNEAGGEAMAIVDPTKSGDTYRGQAGPASKPGAMYVVVTATDVFNNTAVDSTTVDVRDCVVE
jgi:hypothetical protein